MAQQEVDAAYDRYVCPDAMQTRQNSITSGTQQSLPCRRDRTKEAANKPKPKLTRPQKEHLISLLRKDIESCNGREGQDRICVSCEKQQYYLQEGKKLDKAKIKATTDQLKKIVNQSKEATGLDCVRRMPADLRREMVSMIRSH
jgi:hypothetical protein